MNEGEERSVECIGGRGGKREKREQRLEGRGRGVDGG